MLAMLNGELLARRESAEALPELNRVSQYGDGLFETMLVRRGEIHLRQLHLARLARGLQVLQLPAEPGSLEAELDEFLAAIKDEPGYLRVKWLLSRTGTTTGYSTRGTRTQRLLTAVQIEPGTQASAPLHLLECATRLGSQPLLAGLKHCNRLEQVLASMELDAKGFKEGLLLDQQGRVIEAVSANIFLVTGDAVVTPLLDHAGVAGVMREYLLESLLPELGVRATQAEIELQGALDCDAIFLCNATRGVTAVASLTTRDGQRSEFAGSSIVDAIGSRVRQSMVATGSKMPRDS
ncbi:MAG: aminodeoxychorismate lyase [Pseudomonadales bacterium]